MTTALLLSSIFSQLLGSATSAYGQYQQGKAASETYNEAAERAQMETAYAIQQKRREIKKVSGQQKVLYAKAGVDLTSGSPLLVMAETAKEGARQIWWLKKTGSMKATEYENAAKSARTTGNIGGVNTFLTGLSRAGLGLTYGLGTSSVGYTQQQMYDYLQMVK